MFEQPAGKEEKDRSRSIMILSGIAVLAVIVLIIAVTRYKPASGVEVDPVRPLSQSYPESEFVEGRLPCPSQDVPNTEAQAYVPHLLIGDIDKRKGEYPNLNSKYVRILCTVKNAGDRTVLGLEMRMVLFGFNCEVLKEKLINVIPSKKARLAPGESISVDASIDRSPDPSEIMYMRIEPHGLKLN
ncbi:MAG TPA: hypothetical protein VKA60_21800 [Blastocatellia bacterium]|nr:hypothetical protein [Blastocatellia bacterium]